MELAVWSVELRVLSVQCGVGSWECGVLSMEFEVWSGQLSGQANYKTSIKIVFIHNKKILLKIKISSNIL
ncbi:hypothetical protein [Clostridium isatidis]|uniref:Uncharacterized protein n=1 Tax=Clostridium isatidis TaxID=182773 RepID=A0A343J9X8_9CLOT|nr:hypothetical protein [Clostridium isatidis]ASW42336.1 hypothetical protein BEN51_02190 [Clostridium isatidis]